MRTILGASADQPEEFIKLATIIGGPDEVADQIRAYQAAGARHMALVLNWGYMSPEVSNGSIDRFINEVLPQFR
jgi:alkanesulfonate monooxygenase SsuD/methylene tetrahydromethanopterin reductase-like flavin-dependent oxidoreductase (luciferase family)